MEANEPAGLFTRRISRRSLLRGGGVAASGVALFLTGCGSDDDAPPATAFAPTATPTEDPTDEATATATPEATPQATASETAEATSQTAEATSEPTSAATLTPVEALPRKVVVQSVLLTGSDGVIVLKNLGETSVDLSGWFICQRPSYWGLPSITLEPDSELRLHAGAGTDTGTDAYANGAMGLLSGNRGEIGLYSSSSFGSADAIVSFVAWNGRNGRTAVARDAGVWGDDDVTATDGDTLVFVGPLENASGWSVQ